MVCSFDVNPSQTVIRHKTSNLYGRTLKHPHVAKCLAEGDLLCNFLGREKDIRSLFVSLWECINFSSILKTTNTFGLSTSLFCN